MEIVCKNECRELVKVGLDKSSNYNEYMSLMDNLVSNESSSGKVKSESTINFTKLNQRRMKRWNKTLKVNEEAKMVIEKFDKNITWLVLTESWCGDAAHLLPAMNKVASLSSNISFRTVLRDENPELMNNFLTNGTQSIPKLIVVNNENGEVIETYGSRPDILTKMVREYKEMYGSVTAEFKEEMQKWYNKDKGQTIINELLNLL